MSTQGTAPTFTDLDLFADEVLLDPYPTYAALRETAGVVHLPANDVYALTRYDAIRDALGDRETFSSRVDRLQPDGQRGPHGHVARLRPAGPHPAARDADREPLAPGAARPEGPDRREGRRAGRRPGRARLLRGDRRPRPGVPARGRRRPDRLHRPRPRQHAALGPGRDAGHRPDEPAHRGELPDRRRALRLVLDRHRRGPRARLGGPRDLRRRGRGDIPAGTAGHIIHQYLGAGSTRRSPRSATSSRSSPPTRTSSSWCARTRPRAGRRSTRSSASGRRCTPGGAASRGTSRSTAPSSRPAPRSRSSSAPATATRATTRTRTPSSSSATRSTTCPSATARTAAPARDWPGSRPTPSSPRSPAGCQRLVVGDARTRAEQHHPEHRGAPGPRGGAGMRIVLDRPRCEGHGLCEEAAPQLMHLDDDGELVLDREEVGDGDLEAAQPPPSGSVRSRRCASREGAAHDRRRRQRHRRPDGCRHAPRGGIRRRPHPRRRRAVPGVQPAGTVQGAPARRRGPGPRTSCPRRPTGRPSCSASGPSARRRAAAAPAGRRRTAAVRRPGDRERLPIPTARGRRRTSSRCAPSTTRCCSAERLASRPSVLVVGGGPLGMEIASSCLGPGAR